MSAGGFFVERVGEGDLTRCRLGGLRLLRGGLCELAPAHRISHQSSRFSSIVESGTSRAPRKRSIDESMFVGR
jgi:hypothetical protein